MNNLNLVEMLGLPNRLSCPECGEEQFSFFDEYDIDSGKPFKGGKWSLDCICVECEHEWKYNFTAAIL